MPKQTRNRTVKKKSLKTRGQQPSRNTRSIAAAYSHESKTRGIQERPYIQTEEVLNVNSVANDFAVMANIVCQPGLIESFPWLSGHAQLYEKYYVSSITYRFKGIQGSSYAGKVMMSFDYDTLDAPPASSIEVSGATTYISGSPWSQFELKVKTDGRKLFTRSGAVPQGGDPKSYDMGRLYVSCFGCQSAAVLGTIEVSYNISLFDKQPRLSIPVVPQTLVRHARVQHDTSQGFDTATLTGITFGAIIYDTIGVAVDGAGDITVPEGIYLIIPTVTCDVKKFEFCALTIGGATRVTLASSDTVQGPGSLEIDTAKTNTFMYGDTDPFVVRLMAMCNNNPAGIIPAFWTDVEIVQLG